MRIAIVGSGPSAWASALALSKSSRTDFKVTIFEANQENNPKLEMARPNSLKVNSLYKETSINYGEEDTETKIMNEMSPSIDGLPNNLIPGGWSNIWGATILPWSENYFTRHSISMTEMQYSYSEILSHIPYQGESDFLAMDFPLYSQPNSRAKISTFSENFLENFENCSSVQTETKISLGKSRLAISPLSDLQTLGCVQCQKCLSGCPYGHIFNSWNALTKLIAKDERFEMKVASYVRRITLENRETFLETFDSTSAVKSKEVFDKVFIGAGIIQTGRLLQRSGLLGTFWIEETPLIYLPVLVRNWKWRARKLTGATFSELFIVGSKKKDHYAFGQIYSLNTQIIQLLNSRFRFMSPILPILKNISANFGIIMLFVKSDDEQIRFDSNHVGAIDQNIRNSRSRWKDLKGDLAIFQKSMRTMKIHPIITKYLLQKVGASYHFATIKTTNKSGYLESVVNTNGQIKNWMNPKEDFSSIRLIDSSALPGIEPGPITLTVMANSFRITSKFIDNEL